MKQRPACYGMHELFDSTELKDHRKAQAICKTCPVFDECQARLESLQSGEREGRPSGTWAGRLVGIPRSRVRIAREDEMFTDDEARLQHARFIAGHRDDRATVGERVYSRRMHQRVRARKVAAELEDGAA